MAFKIIGERLTQNTFSAPISSITVAKGDLLVRAVGATTWSLATSSSEHWQLKAVAQGAATTSDTSVLAVEVQPNCRVEVETVNNSAAADNGDRMVLTDANTVNNTGTDDTSQNAMFIQESPVGAAADKRVTGILVWGSGVNPDAA